MKFWKASRPFLILALVAIAPSWRFVIGGKVPAPVDQVQTTAPWNGKQPDAPFDVLQADGALQFLPWRDLMLEAWQKGEVPLWNPYSLGGVPFLANSQSAPLYPLHPAAAWLGLGAEELMRVSVWLHLWIAACGVYLLCRRLGGTEIGGLLGGSAFAVSAFLVAWIQLPSVGMTAAWIPWCLLGVSRFCDEPNGKNLTKLSIPIGLMLLAGHLQIAVYGLLATLLFAIWSVVERKLWKASVGLVFGIVLGGLIAAAQLIPSLENGANGHRAGEATAEGYKRYKRQALGLHHMVTLFAPTGFGMPNEWFVEQGHDDHGDEKGTNYWLGFSEPGKHYAELAYYVGPVVLPLALVGFFVFRRERSIGFFGFLVLLSLLIALGTVVTQAMYFWIPGWSATGSPGRILVLFALSVCVLAGASIREESTASKLLLGAIGGSLITGSLVSIVWLMKLSDPMQATAALSSLPFVGIGVIGIALALFCFAGKEKKVAGTLCLLLTIATSAYLHRNVNLGSDLGKFRTIARGLGQVENIAKFSRIAVVNESWNFLGPLKNSFAYPNSLLPFRIHEIGGYDSIIPKVRKETLDDINGQDSAPPINGNMMLIKPGFDPAKLAAIGVGFVVSKIPQPLDMVFQEGDWALYAIPNDPMACQTVRETFNTKVITTGGNLPLEAQILGWEWLDGATWKALNQESRLPTGQEIALAYRPGSFKTGIFLSLVSVLSLFAIYCMGTKRRDANRTDTSRSA